MKSKAKANEAKKKKKKKTKIIGMLTVLRCISDPLDIIALMPCEVSHGQFQKG